MHVRRRVVPLLPLGLAMAAFLFAATSGFAGTVVSCGFSGSTGDVVDRGIVVPNYPGTNVRLVQIGYGASVAGRYNVTLQIHRGTFDGPTVGTSSIYLDMPGGSFEDVNGLFHFGGEYDGAPVTPGDTLALVQTYSGPGPLTFDVGAASGCGGAAYETEGTSPPLDTMRRNGVGIEVDQEDLTSACIPGDTVLCLSDTPGDRRFKLTMEFSHAGGASGSAQAITGIGGGPTHGGTFWFFSESNPEVLVKVLNGCSFNHKFWVFFSAGTNVGFTLHVEDTSTGVTNTYSNTDGVAALPVQDTSAFPCP